MTALADNPEPRIIPQPVSIAKGVGSFQLGGKITISVSSSNADLAVVSRHLAERLGQATGQPATVQASAAAIQLRLLADRDIAIGDEGYRLKVEPGAVTLSANMPAGLFYGMQTFLQLLPPESEKAISGTTRTFDVPCLEIVDYPRFAWRGLLLDVSRHFFTKDEVKNYIDDMVRYKFNVFHWHLSDDQGWRVEIKKYPKLTEVGAWRVPRQGVWWSFAPPQPNEKASEGGFYTQDDIREIVAYARERFVNIMPEIDVPGHSMAALAAYPELSCGGGPFTVNPGSQFYGRIENGLCPGQEFTYKFYNDVVAELVALFPFKYFHMGGDEACHGFWEKCPRCQAICKEIGRAHV